jgi:hypothetical protein
MMMMLMMAIAIRTHSLVCNDNDNDGENNNINNWFLVRCVGSQKNILCTRMEWMQGGTAAVFSATTSDNIHIIYPPPANTTQLSLSSHIMLRMPDGWVMESAVDHIPIPLSGVIDATGPVSSTKTE